MFVTASFQAHPKATSKRSQVTSSVEPPALQEMVRGNSPWKLEGVQAAGLLVPTSASLPFHHMDLPHQRSHWKVPVRKLEEPCIHISRYTLSLFFSKLWVLVQTNGTDLL